MPTTISRDEWLQAVDEAKRTTIVEDPSLLTLGQYAALMGVHVNTARRQLAVLVAAGRAERLSRVVRAVDGSMRRVPAFRLVKP